MSAREPDHEDGRLLHARLASQLLRPPLGPQPVRAVAHLCAVQAQDERWTPWTVGLRASGLRHTDVDDALLDHRLVRTWLLRGTLHLVAQDDLGWLRRLVAPRVIDKNASRYRQLDLDERTLELGANHLAGALQDGPQPRATLARVLEGAGLNPAGQRLPYLLQYAALTARLVCWPAAGREPVYAPAPAAPTDEPTLDRSDLLTRLARRYLTGHGPASAEDLAWWSGFPLQAARHALNSLPELHTFRWKGRDLVTIDPDPAHEPQQSAHLLPPFDEYLLGYRDRAPVIPAEHATRFHRAGGMPRRALLLNGAVAGTWTTTGTARRQRLEVAAYEALTRNERGLAETAATSLRRFYGDDRLHLTFVDT